jgi:hypothetical protein
MRLPANQRREHIARVSTTYAPDLLLCAGWSLEADADLFDLAQDARVSEGTTTLIVEVKCSPGEREPEEQEHRVYLVSPGNHVQSLGRQVVITSKQVKTEGARRVGLFETLIREKSAVVHGHKLITLCCGEINLLRGREIVEPQSTAIEHALLGADIIVNPTHDRMGNAGTLKAKRAWLSQNVGGRRRVYISCSNWNSDQGQRPRAKTLHTVFQSGVMKPLSEFEEFVDPSYVYRQCEIAL